MNRPRKSEAAFADLIRDRLIDTPQVRDLVGLRSIQGLMHRVDHGHYSGPILVRERGYALWDRVQVEREEKERLASIKRQAT